jgi:hypothetical protein
VVCLHPADSPLHFVLWLQLCELNGFDVLKLVDESRKTSSIFRFLLDVRLSRIHEDGNLVNFFLGGLGDECMLVPQFTEEY